MDNAVYWFEQTAAELPDNDAWLTVGESARLCMLRFPKRRADWRLGRWTAKRAVAAILRLPSLGAVEIRSATSGAPEAFVAGGAAPVTISLSHRADVAVCAVAGPGVALGCDIELVEPRCDLFAADYFTTKEQALVEGAPAADRLRLLTLLWSAKESVLKALGEGLRLDTRCVSTVPSGFAVPGGSTWRPLVACYCGREFRGWWRLMDDLVRTVVAVPSHGPPETLR